MQIIRMILGSFISGLADACGRKKLCLCYCLAYTVSVFTKHCRYFYVLMFGRICGGIATSLLYSCFESWLVCAHGKRGLIGQKRAIHNEKKEDEERWLAQSLTISMYGNSLVAIGSGILANFVVESSGDIRPLFGTADDGTSALYIGGFISAFDMCIVPLLLCATLIACLWKENYGEEMRAFSEDNLDSELFLSQGSEQKKSRFCCLIFSKKSQYRTSLDHNNGNESTEETARETANTNAYSLDQGIERPNLQDTEEQLESPLLLLKVKKQRKKLGFSALSDGIITVWQSPSILICCIVGSAFEGSIYIFIFLFTPILTSLHAQLAESPNATDKLPFGMMFSSFMASCMLGTVAFSYLSNAGVAAAECLIGVLAIAAISCLVIACPLYTIGSGYTSLAKTPQYFGMFVYELCVGL